MRKNTAFLAAFLVTGLISCSKETDKPGWDNNWVFNERTIVAKTVTIYAKTSRLAASDGQSVLRISFFGGIPKTTGFYKIVSYAPTAPNEISIAATSELKKQYVGRNYDTTLKASVTIENERLKISVPKTWVVSTPLFKDSVQVSATLVETQVEPNQ